MSIFTKGVIEGFFGTPWDNIQRLTFPKWLEVHKFDFYIYAPKNDSALRKNWQTPFEYNKLSYLKILKASCQKSNIKMGIGFTPLGSTANLDSNLPIIKQQVTTLLNEVKPDILALLFDDLKIDNEHEGYKQNLIIKAIYELTSTNNCQLFVCPSYYSTDPILEKVFGKQPECYYQEFLHALPQDIEIFWTGEKVLSTNYSQDHLKLATEILGRKPFIWDNYPVNDGKKASDYIYTAPFKNRSHLKNYASGIAINPLKQMNLSKISLTTLNNAIESNSENKREKAYLISIAELYQRAPKFATYITPKLNIFSKTPLSEMDLNLRTTLIHELSDIYLEEQAPETKELISFLLGEDAFDPNCLTG